MTEQNHARPLTEAVSIEATELIEKSIQGQEAAYQQVLSLALRATTNLDWQDFGGKPYLGKTGAVKVALRLGVSIMLDRIGGKDGAPNFNREDFDDALGKLCVYTISGRASFSNGRTIEEIGTASTRDQFLGMEAEKDAAGNTVSKKDADGNEILNEWKKPVANQVPVAFHEAIQDAKKKCVSNFYSRAITAAIGLGGLSWDDLAKYGVSKVGKAKVDFKSSKGPKAPSSTPPPSAAAPKKGGKAPFWVYEMNDGGRRIYLMAGSHFTEEFLNLHKLKRGNKTGQYWGDFSDALWQECEKQYSSVEAGDAEPREPGAEG